MSDATSLSSFPETDTATSGLHRFAISVAVLALVGVLTGAMVTSTGGTSFVELHHMTAGLAALGAVALGIWLVTKQSAQLGWILIATTLLEGALGFAPAGEMTGIGHAMLAQLLLALSTAAVVVTGSTWTKPVERVEDHGWPSLGSLGTITPVLVLVQVALGAAFRHKAMSVLPHLFGAMVLVLLILCICIFVMQQFPTHPVLRPCANHLLAIAFTQIFLGIAAFTVRTMTIKAANVVTGVTAVHTTVGAMTLAAAVVLSMQIRRNVFKPEPTE